MSIVEVLNATLSPDKIVRENAENVLKNMDNIVQACMSAVTSTVAGDDEKLAASIYLKSVCRTRWSVNENDKSKPLSNEDKDFFLKNCVELLAANIDNSKISVQLLAAAANVYRELEVRGNNWSDIYVQIKRLFESQSDALYLTALKLLGMVFSECQATTRHEKVLDIFADTIIACIQHLGSRSGMQLALIEAVSEFIAADICAAYNNVYDVIVPYLITTLDSACEDPQGEAIIISGAKCLHFESIKYLQNTDHRFSKYAVPFCNLLMSILRRLGTYTTTKEKMINVIIETVIRFFDTKRQVEGYKVIEGHLEFIIKELIYPSMCYNEKDVALWQSDPIEATSEEKMRSYLFETPDAFFVSLIRDKPETTRGVLNFVVEKLNYINSEGEAALNQSVGVPNGLDAQKDGCLRILNLMSEGIMDNMPEAAEELTKIHIYGCMASPSPFIRLRGLTVICGFMSYGAEFSEPLLKELFLASARALEDPSLPVRCQSAQTLQPFWQLVIEDPGEEFKYGEFKQFMMQYHQQIMESMFKIAGEEGMTDNFAVIESISDLIMAFKEHIVGLAEPAVRALIEKVDILVATSSDDTDGYINALFSITSSYDAIASIMTAVYVSKDMDLYHRLDDAIYAVTKKVLQLETGDNRNMIEEVIVLYSRSPYLSANIISMIPSIVEICENSNAQYILKFFSNLVMISRNTIDSVMIPFPNGPQPIIEVIFDLANKMCTGSTLSPMESDEDNWMEDDYNNVVFNAWDMVCIFLEFQLDLPRKDSINIFYESMIELFKIYLEDVSKRFVAYADESHENNRNNVDYQENLAIDGTFAVRIWSVLFLYDPASFMTKIKNFEGSFKLISDLILCHSVKSIAASKTYILWALKIISMAVESNDQALQSYIPVINETVVHAMECLGEAGDEYIKRYTHISWEEPYLSPLEYEWEGVDTNASVIRSVNELELLSASINKGMFQSVRDQLLESLKRHEGVLLKVQKMEKASSPK